jgi:hypothetical protein
LAAFVVRGFTRSTEFERSLASRLLGCGTKEADLAHGLSAFWTRSGIGGTTPYSKSMVLVSRGVRDDDAECWNALADPVALVVAEYVAA